MKIKNNKCCGYERIDMQGVGGGCIVDYCNNCGHTRKSKNEIKDLKKERDLFVKNMTIVERENTRLREYVSHDYDCRKETSRDWVDPKEIEEIKCDCGLDKLLKG